MTPLGLKLVQKYQPCCRYIPVQNVSVCTLIPWLPMINTSKKHPLCGAFQNPNPPNKSPNIFHRPTNPNPRVAIPSRCPHCPFYSYPSPPVPPQTPSASSHSQPCSIVSVAINPHRTRSNGSLSLPPLFSGPPRYHIHTLCHSRVHPRGGGGKGAPSRSPSSLTIHRTRSNGFLFVAAPLSHQRHHILCPLSGATKAPYPYHLPSSRPPTSRRGGGRRGLEPQLALPFPRIPDNPPHQIQRFLFVAAPLSGATIKAPYPLPSSRPPTSRRRV